jgi:hypothetical protein
VAQGGSVSGGFVGVEVSSGGSVSNYGSITGYLGGVVAYSGVLAATNGGYIFGGQIAVFALDTLSLDNTGTIVSNYTGVYAYTGGGTVTNSGIVQGNLYGVHFGNRNAASAVLNSGTIAGAYPWGTGIYLQSGTVINSGLVQGGSASGVGIGLTRSATVTNASGGQITGYYGIHTTGTLDLYNAGSIVSSKGFGVAAWSGTIQNDLGLIQGASFGVSIASSHPSGVYNAANSTIAATAAKGTGVSIEAGRVQNSGTIEGGSLGTGIAGGTGIMVENDAGVVSGGTGVALAAFGHGTLVNSATIIGGAAGTGVSLGMGSVGYITNATGGSISGGGYGIKALGSLDLTVQADSTISGAAADGVYVHTGNVINSGSIYGGQAAISSGVHGAIAITNQQGGVISGGAVAVDAAGSLALANYGSITSGTGSAVYAQYGVVTNETGGVISGDRMGVQFTSTAKLSTVANYGTISAQTYGVSVGTGVVDNNGGVITGSMLEGVLIWTGGTVSNTGGVITGLDRGVALYGVGAAVSNLGGTIAATGSGGTGVAMFSAGVVHNYGGDIYGSTGVKMAGGGVAVNAAGSTITGTNGVGVYATSGTVVNAGTISGSLAAVEFDNAANAPAAPSLLVVEAGAVFQGAVVAAAGLGAGIDLASPVAAGSVNSPAPTFNMGGTVTGFGSITFAAGATWTLEGNAAELAAGQTIVGFGGADTIDLTNIAATTGHFANGVLSLYGTGGLLAQLDFAEPAGSPFTLSSAGIAGGTEITLCFYPGTRIATPWGDVAVENLRAGNLVLTAAGARPVRWLGQSQVSTRFADPLRSLPIRIAAGALGEGLPLRDLLVSPDHALYLEGMLVHASALVGLPGITREHNVPEQFTYYHVELDSHELLFAEGALAESFVDNAGRWHFHNWDERAAPAEPIAELDLPRVKSARQLPQRLRPARAA